MYLINTSFHVERPLYDDVVKHVSTSLLPAMKASGIFRDPLLCHILVDVDENCRSFTLQAFADDHQSALQWLQEGDGAALLQALMTRYPGRALFFTTPMEVMQ